MCGQEAGRHMCRLTVQAVWPEGRARDGALTCRMTAAGTRFSVTRAHANEVMHTHTQGQRTDRLL